jgi:hypothetical protein
MHLARASALKSRLVVDAGALPCAVRALAIGLAIALVQVAAATAIAWATGAGSPAESYRSLCRWDGKLYLAIATQGYHGAAPSKPLDFDASNVAFFPGYPLAGRWLSAATPLAPDLALLVVAQSAACGFWAYWLLFLDRFRLPRASAIAGTLVVALHPAAFFLVVAYSESLFLCSLLGFLFWTTSSSTARWPLAAAHGLVMTATRLGGLPVAFCPLAAQALAELAPSATALHAGFGRLREIGRRLWPLALACGLASLGGIAFLAWCQWRFGAWDLYMQTQRAGWDLVPDWGWWRHPINYVCTGSLWHPNVLWPDDLSRLCTTLTLLAFGVAAVFEVRLARRGGTGWKVRLVFYLAALVLFWLHAAGVSSIVMKSMIRYCLGPHVLLLLAAAHGLGSGRSTWWHTRRNVLLWGCALAAMTLVQAALAWRFFSDQWAA